MTTKNTSIKVKADDREPKSIFIFADMEDGLELKRQRLKVGDYIYKDCCVERKQIDDFCGSIIDGRLIHQIKNMKKEFKYNYIIIVGHIKDRISTIHENCILGKISSIVVKHQIPIIMVDDEFQFLYLIKSIFKKHDDMKLN